MSSPRDPFQAQNQPISQDGRHTDSRIGGSGGLVEGMRRFRAERTRQATPDMPPPAANNHSVERPSTQRRYAERPRSPSENQSQDRQTVEQSLSNLIADERYRAEGPDADRFRDTVTEAFRVAYPGPYEPGSWGRWPNGDRIPPSTTPEDLEWLFRSRMGDGTPPYILTTVPVENANGSIQPDDVTTREYVHQRVERAAGAVQNLDPERDRLRQAAHGHLEELDLTSEERAAVEDELERRIQGSDESVRIAGAQVLPLIGLILAALGITAAPKDEESQRQLEDALDDLLEMEELPAPAEDRPAEEDETDQEDGTLASPDPNDEDPNEDPPPEDVFNLLPTDPGGHLIHGGDTPVAEAGFSEQNRQRVEGRDPGITFNDDERRRYDEFMQGRGGELLSERRAREASGQGRGGSRIARAESFIWRTLTHWQTINGRPARTNRQSGADRRFYTWDGENGHIEVFGADRRHMGAIDGLTGEWVSPPRHDRRLRKADFEEPINETAARPA